MKSPAKLISFVLFAITAQQSYSQSTIQGNSLSGTSPNPTQFLGSDNAYDVVFKAGSSSGEKMRLLLNGNFGIGTPAPDKLLTVSSPGLNTQIAKFVDNARYIGLGRDEIAAYDLSGNLATLFLAGAKMTIATNGYVGIGVGSGAPTEKLHVMGNGLFQSSGINVQVAKFADATKYIGLGRDEVAAFDVVTGNLSNLYLGGGGKLTILTNGNVGVGITNPTTKFHMVGDATVNGKMLIGEPTSGATTSNNYKLFVQTGILTEKVKVALINTSDWADYVFDKNYKLNTLSEVSDYISTNKHLPGVPSANELVEQGGFDLAKMDAKLLEKIEELTLYIIQLNKEKKELEDRLTKLESSK